MCDLAELLAESQAWKLSSKSFNKVNVAPGTLIASYLYDDDSESVTYYNENDVDNNERDDDYESNNGDDEKDDDIREDPVRLSSSDSSEDCDYERESVRCNAASPIPNNSESKTVDMPAASDSVTTVQHTEEELMTI